MPRIKSDGGKKDIKRSRNQSPDMQEITIKKKRTGLNTASLAMPTAPVLEIPKIPLTEPKSSTAGMRAWLASASSKELDTLFKFLQQKRAVNSDVSKQRQPRRQATGETKDPRTSRSRHPDEGIRRRTSMGDQRVKCVVSLEDLLRMEEALGGRDTVPRMRVKQKLSARWSQERKTTTLEATTHAEAADCPGEKIYKDILDSTLTRNVDARTINMFVN